MNLIANLPGYQIGESLYAGSRTLVYRGIRESDRRPVVIKVLRNPFPSFNQLVRFRNQYTITQNIDSPSIVTPLALEPCQNGYALVMEDFGDISLQQHGQSHLTPLQETLEIALQMADILNVLCQHRVVHQAINPTHILIHPGSTQVKLIDFSSASLLPKETQEIQNPNVLEGRLAYLAPEQTGRMNRGIDYRVDFYGLGVTLYELLTGELPFQSDNPLELVHCHIAQTPTPPHQVNSAIPPMVSAIVLKLMAKNAEDRYQSALGLRYDLEQCLSQWRQVGEIVAFKVGQRDLSDRFLIPEKLYGREAEVQTLLDAFERIAKGHSEMMLVAGFSGIGKTAVVNEVHKPITRQQGYFIKGKFDQFDRAIPFSAIVQAFRSLMGQVLSESDANLTRWKEKILEAVAKNGQVIIDVIPELERVIGQQPAVPKLSGVAAQNRFNLIFGNFIRVFTTKAHPLVIFLDDLQWADSASLSLLKLLMDVSEADCLLILGAYRNNEVFSAHPLMLTLNEIQKQRANINTLTLAPLNQVDITRLVADTLRCSTEIAAPLSQLVYQKTQGNPFFATQFLRGLHQDGWITFTPPQSPLGKGGSQGGWQCDLAQVRQLALTDDVVEFMVGRLRKLPKATQAALKLAACIGNRFDLATLAMVCEESQDEAATDLWRALQEGFVVPESETYKFFQGDEREEKKIEAVSVGYRFLHDRVQQAAYCLIPDNQKQAIHCQIGQLLLQRISPEAREERIFEIVNQLNYGDALITEQSERDQLAQLNLLAGRKARLGTAYQAAHEYAAIGLTLLGGDAWRRKYEITLKLHEIAAEAAAITSDSDAMNQWINAVIDNGKSFLDQVDVYIIKIQFLTTQNNFLEAISCGQSALKKIGIDFPDSVTSANLKQAIEEVNALTCDLTIEQLLHLPAMVDTEKLAIIKIAGRMIPACYLANSSLFPLLACLQVKLSLQYGNSPISSTGYADYGIFILNFQKDIATSNQFGQLAYHLASTSKDKNIYAVTFVPIGLYLYHHQYHLRQTLPIFEVGYQAALEIGKFEYAGHHGQGFCAISQ
ncbi:MAG: serine/threonine-protein kinase PknK [Leptolyngbyaceae cyanobacterium MO_188.B28]|nr:serine/threonine-protein kinase PknK [Leptolyngbyaceae cyanobacterium MO_188.B28]